MCACPTRNIHVILVACAYSSRGLSVSVTRDIVVIVIIIAVHLLYTYIIVYIYNNQGARHTSDDARRTRTHTYDVYYNISSYICF